MLALSTTTPDMTGAAVAQGIANKEAAVASSRLNNPNVVNPYGTRTWQEGATAEDRPTLTQTFSPEQQALYEQSMQTKGLLGGLGTQGATALQGIIGNSLDLSGAPAAPGSAEQTRQGAYDAIMSRVNEDAGQRDQRNSNLIAAGIRPEPRLTTTRRTRFLGSTTMRVNRRSWLPVGKGSAISRWTRSAARMRLLRSLLAVRPTERDQRADERVASDESVCCTGSGAELEASPAPLFWRGAGTVRASVDRSDAGAAQEQRNDGWAILSAVPHWALQLARSSSEDDHGNQPIRPN